MRSCLSSPSRAQEMPGARLMVHDLGVASRQHAEVSWLQYTCSGLKLRFTGNAKEPDTARNLIGMQLLTLPGRPLTHQLSSLVITRKGP